MDYEEFEYNILKRNQKRNSKPSTKKNSLILTELKKLKRFDSSVYIASKILVRIFLLLKEEFKNEGILKLPIGDLVIKKVNCKKDNIDNSIVDWKSTLISWYKSDKCRENKTITRFYYGHKYRIVLVDRKKFILRYYNYKPNRYLCLEIRELSKTKNIIHYV